MEAAAQPVTTQPASASTVCRACEGVECARGESCYVHEDGATTACFPSGLELSGWTECPRPDDDDDGDDGGGDDGDGGGDDEGGGDDGAGDDGGEDEGEQDDEEGEDEGGGEEDGEGDDEGDDEDGEGDEEGGEDGWDTGEDEGEPGAGGCAGFAPWPDDLAGRMNMLTQMVDRAASILAIQRPPVLFEENAGPNLVALYNAGQIRVNRDLLEAGDTTFDEWMETVLHEMHHAYQGEMASLCWRELSRHRVALRQRGVNYREEIERARWQADVEDFIMSNLPDDPALIDVWEWAVYTNWLIGRDQSDLTEAPGTLKDPNIPDEEWNAYVTSPPERQARQFTPRAMDDYGLRCNKPGDVKESAGRSQ